MKMESFFPEPIMNLPKADIPIEGLDAYLSQGVDHQLVFMQFDKDAELPEHAHAAQVGFVLAGMIELTIDGVTKRFGKGDVYHIPAGVKHSGRIFWGYSDITFFAEAHRYRAIEE